MKPNRIPKPCPCGNPGVKLMPGSYWSCVQCLEKDAVVEKIHRSMVELEKRSVEEEEASYARTVENIRRRYYARKQWKAQHAQRGSAWRHKVWQAQPNAA